MRVLFSLVAALALLIFTVVLFDNPGFFFRSYKGSFSDLRVLVLPICFLLSCVFALVFYYALYSYFVQEDKKKNIKKVYQTDLGVGIELLKLSSREKAGDLSDLRSWFQRLQDDEPIRIPTNQGWVDSYKKQ